MDVQVQMWQVVLGFIGSAITGGFGLWVALRSTLRDDRTAKIVAETAAQEAENTKRHELNEAERKFREELRAERDSRYNEFNKRIEEQSQLVERLDAALRDRDKLFGEQRRADRQACSEEIETVMQELVRSRKSYIELHGQNVDQQKQINELKLKTVATEVPGGNRRTDPSVAGVPVVPAMISNLPAGASFDLRVSSAGTDVTGGGSQT